MATTTSTGIESSFAKTPQAKDDTYDFSEDLLLQSGIYDNATGNITLNVMSNDLGGAAKTLFSISDGDGNPLTSDFELLTKDTLTAGVSAWEKTNSGNWIRINNGTIDFALGSADDVAGPSGISVNTLAANQTVSDSFVMSIRLGNGTISQANVFIGITGNNDAATITADTTSSDYEVTEAGGVANGTLGDPFASGKLTIVDLDAGQSVFQVPESVTGSYGIFTFNAATGEWTYLLDNTNAAVEALNTGSEPLTDSLIVTSLDGTASHTITVSIKGTNDAPVITTEAGGNTDSVVETGVSPLDTLFPGEASASGTLSASDVDAGAMLAWSGNAMGTYGSFVIDADSGEWNYTLDNDAANTNALAEGEEAFDTFTATVADEVGATATQVVTITITGTNDAPVITTEVGGNGGAVVETGVSPGEASATGTLSASDVDTGATQAWSGDATSSYGSFAIDAASGAWTYTLDNNAAATNALADGEEAFDTFTATVTDEFGATATQVVTIAITGTNDAANVSSANVGLTETDAELSTSGSLTSDDVDNPDNVFTASAMTGEIGNFSIDATGAWSFTANSTFDELNTGDSVTETFDVTSVDATPSTVTITINGTNDAAVLSSAVVALDETDAALMTSGALTNADIDNPDTFVPQTDVSGTHGTFSISEAGAWSYSANSAFDSLNVGESVSDTFSVAAADGTLTSVEVTISGTNDIPVISGETTGDRAVKEDSDLSASGTLSIFDADAGQSEFAPGAGPTTYGSYTLDANGAWSYTLNNADTTVQALGEGVQISDSFVAVSEDGTAFTTVTITITGTADGAVAAPPVYNSADPNDKDNDIVGPGAGVMVSGTATNSANTIVGTNNADNISAQQGNDTVYGYGGDDTLSGDNDTDTIYGGAGNDTIDGGNGTDLIFGGSGNDSIDGGNGTDLIYGGSGNDVIVGGQGIDSIYGGSGNDSIQGNMQDDVIIGGFGADTLTGGGGDDTFAYLDIRDTGDTITDFGTGDKIDLSAIDANSTTPGNDIFLFGGNTTTLAPNSVIWFIHDNDTPPNLVDDYAVVQADTDGDIGTAELEIHLTGVTTLVATDFVL